MKAQALRGNTVTSHMDSKKPMEIDPEHSGVIHLEPDFGVKPRNCEVEVPPLEILQPAFELTDLDWCEDMKSLCGQRGHAVCYDPDGTALARFSSSKSLSVWLLAHVLRPAW